jgi:hypothetical protein
MLTRGEPLSEHDREGFPEAVFHAYRIANLIYPQTDIGVVPIVSAALLPCDIPAFRVALTRSFTASQKTRLRAAMDFIHHVFAVPVNSKEWLDAAAKDSSASTRRTAKVVTDDRLDDLWINIASFIASGMLQFLEAIAPERTSYWPLPKITAHADRVETLAQMLASDPQSRDQLTAAFSCLDTVLHGRDALTRSRNYRLSIRGAALSLQQVMPVLRTGFELELGRLLSDGIRPRFPGIARLIDDREWIVMRQLGRVLSA